MKKILFIFCFLFSSLILGLIDLPTTNGFGYVDTNTNIAINTINSKQPTFENLTVLVPSCDKYAEVWNPFFALLVKYWPAITNNDIYLISNAKTYANPHNLKIHSILIPNEKSWSDNMLTALDNIKDDYVLVILEDDLLTTPVNSNRILELYQVMQEEHAANLHLIAKAGVAHQTVQGLAYVSNDAKYRVSLQASIWHKDELRKVLLQGENPWYFELRGTERSKSIDKPFLTVTENQPIHKMDALLRGHWTPEAVEFLKNENIPMDYTLPINSKFVTWLKGPCRNFLSKYISQPIKKLLGVDYILPVNI